MFNELDGAPLGLADQLDEPPLAFDPPSHPSGERCVVRLVGSGRWLSSVVASSYHD
jgi:hypothetical protein